MHRIYQYALKQRVFNIFGSEYARKALDFSSLAIARDLVRGGWHVRGTGALRTLRLAPNAAPPNLVASAGLAGYAPGPNALYLHLTGATAYIADGSAKTVPYLRTANGRVDRWDRRGDTIQASFHSHTPLELELGAAAGCELYKDGRLIRPVTPRGAEFSADMKSYVLVDTGPIELSVRCR